MAARSRAHTMSLLRVIVCLLLPPAAVLDKGCGPIVLTTVLTLAGWVPGVIAAIIFCTRPPAPSVHRH